MNEGEALTERQLEVARLISDGLTDKQIAGALGISFQRVAQIIDTIRGKLQLDPQRDARLQIAKRFTPPAA